MLTLDPQSTALVLIDLQYGILALDTGPYTSDVVFDRCKELAEQFRAAKAPVVLVNVAFAKDFADAPPGIVDQPTKAPEGGLPDNWSVLAEGLADPSDLLVTKHQWGAFTGTDLDVQLRRRGISTVVVAGIATNIGVESTVRHAWELGYNVVVAEDACATYSAEMHKTSVETIFPRISRVVAYGDIALSK